MMFNASLATQNDTSYFGPVTGRVAQRIARGRFVLDGKAYHLYRNDGNNTIHGTGAEACSARIRHRIIELYYVFVC
jgi:galactose mutarotase-like enzyme